MQSRQKEMLEVLGTSTGILEESNKRVSKNEADIGEMLRGLALERETNACMQQKLLQKIEELEDKIQSKVDVDEVADQVTKTLRFDLVLTKTKNVPVTNRIENVHKKVFSRCVTASSKCGKRVETLAQLKIILHVLHSDTMYLLDAIYLLIPGLMLFSVI